MPASWAELSCQYYLASRAIARSENPGGHIVLGGDNVPPLVEIGLTDLPKTGGAKAPPSDSPASTYLVCIFAM